MAKNKTNKVTAEQRLLKSLEAERQTEAIMQLLMPPKVWAYLETLSRLYLQSQNDSPAARDFVSQMALTCRQEAMARFGHDSVETFALAKLLRSGPRWQPKAPRPDSLTHIAHYLHKPHRLSTEQESAATNIIAVWAAYGKFLEVSGRGIGGGGSSRSTALGPVDVMGEELWAHHRDIYSPWHFAACRTAVARRHAGPGLTMAALVFKILVEDVYPEEADRNYALFGGTALKALKAALDSYTRPELLAKWGKKPAPAA